ncbi:MAG TPA: ribosome silencing factor [Anaeromyxobacteraceae bacterium]|jgi:ribosome-associated protein|nr:ribosome silencing factor [Anaeromyxobacteraceae bacterium]
MATKKTATKKTAEKSPARKGPAAKAGKVGKGFKAFKGAKAKPARKPARDVKKASPANRGRGAKPAKRFKHEKAPVVGTTRKVKKAAAQGQPVLTPRKRQVLAPRDTAAEVAEAAAAPSPREENRPDPARETALSIAQAGLDKKAQEVLLLDVRGLTSYADWFVVMTADSERQAGAIADAVDEKLKAAGQSKVGSEGYSGGRWVLIDYGDVVAHVFSREARQFYDLEGLWADAPRFPVEG